VAPVLNLVRSDTFIACLGLLVLEVLIIYCLILFTDEGILIETERRGTSGSLALVQGPDQSTNQGHVLVHAQRGRLCEILISQSGIKLYLNGLMLHATFIFILYMS
jgi:hypothetical protein